MERRSYLAGLVGIGGMTTLAGCSELPDIGGVGGGIDTSAESIPGEGQSAQQFIKTHTAALAAAGSFQSELSLSRMRGEEATSSGFTYRIGADRAFSRSEQQQQVNVRYTAGGVTYQQVKASVDAPASEAQYAMEEEPYEQLVPVNQQRGMHGSVLFPFIVSYYKTGEEMFDGDSVTVYRAVEEEGKSGVRNASRASDATVDSFEGKMSVDSDEIVRVKDLAYKLSKDSSSLETDLSLEITGVGETSVEEPSWIGRAKQQQQEVATETPTPGGE